MEPIKNRFALAPLLVFALAPFLISACVLAALVLVYGLVRLLFLLGLNSWILPVWVIGFPIALPLGFWFAVRIGRRLLGDGMGGRGG